MFRMRSLVGSIAMFIHRQVRIIVFIIVALNNSQKPSESYH